MRYGRGRAGMLAFLLLLCGPLLLSVGCESGTEGADSYWVTYVALTEVQGQGSAVINRVFYDDETGTQEIELDPAEEEWSESVLLAPGDTFYFRAEGTFTTGRMTLQIQIQGDDGSILARTADGMPTSDGEHFVEIARETLP